MSSVINFIKHNCIEYSDFRNDNETFKEEKEKRIFIAVLGAFISILAWFGLTAPFSVAFVIVKSCFILSGALYFLGAILNDTRPVSIAYCCLIPIVVLCTPFVLQPLK